MTDLRSDDDLIEIGCVTDKIAEALYDAGIENCGDIATVSQERLEEIDGINSALAGRMKVETETIGTEENSLNDDSTTAASSQTVQKSDLTQENAYEVYNSRIALAVSGIAALVLGFIVVAKLLDGTLLDAEYSLLKIALIVGWPFFFPFGVGALYQAIKHEPVLQITDDGISYNKLIGATEFYPWSNIEQISRVERGYRNFYLRIQVTEMNNKSPLTKILIQIHKARFGDDTNARYISTHVLGIEFKEIAEVVEHYSDVPITVEDI